jgi:hypothetical protein
MARLARAISFTACLPLTMLADLNPSNAKP